MAFTRLKRTLTRLEFRTEGYCSPVATIFLVINTAIFLPCFFTQFTSIRLAQYLTFARADLFNGQIWRLITAGVTHEGVIHFVLNMVFFMFFAKESERRLGHRGFFALIMSTIVISGLLNAALWPYPYLGFSGVVYAVLVAFAVMHPHARFFGLIPAWLLVGLYVSIDLLRAFQPNNPQRVAYVVHLTGAVLGFVVIYYHHWLARIPQRWRAYRQQRMRHIDSSRQAEVDRLLEKVGREGLPALSNHERKFLQRYSQEQRRKGDA